jgi:hypothetical protein
MQRTQGMQIQRDHLDHDDKVWLATVAGCCLFVLAILLYWSRLRGY